MFSLSTPEIAAWVGGFMWPFVRIGAMLMAAPLFGARTVPVRIRMGLAVLLTVLMLPVVPPPPAVDPLSAPGVLILAQQVLIGAAMGFILQMVFGALSQAGEAVAMTMGLGFASMIDPQNGVQTPVVSQHYVIMATLLFLALDGHLVAIEVLARSFELLPLGVEGLSREALWQLAVWGVHMYAGAVLIALPAVISMLLVNIAFGVITRSAPQLNIFAVGFPMTLMIGFLLLMVTLPSLIPQVSDLMMDAFTLIGDLLVSG
jgi:flagellar biosynthetic protein FliR